MRDLLITLIVFAGCIYTFKKPYLGVLLWSWLSYMNPHRLSYGFAYGMPYAQITAIVLFVAMFLSAKNVRKPPLTGITFLWIFFIMWMGVTTLTAYYPEWATEQYVKVIKIQLVIFLTMMLIDDINKLRQLIWVIVVSIGYYSVKGGVFTALTGGSFRVYGPADTFIADNNALAVAVLMIVALMSYLFQIETRKNYKIGLLVSIILSLFTVLGSQSRGALLAIAVVGLVYWAKSDKKVIVGILIAVLSVLLVSFMPDTWHERMNTIETYDTDASAMGRINAWKYAYRAANDRLFGMGFESWMPETFAIYAPNPLDVHAAHSIYFSVLADHGWIGLFMFLLFYFLIWRALSKIIAETSKSEELIEYNILSKMLQVGFIAYFIGGTFLSLSYFDLPWHFASFVLILQRILAEKTLSPVVMRSPTPFKKAVVNKRVKVD